MARIGAHPFRGRRLRNRPRGRRPSPPIRSCNDGRCTARCAGDSDSYLSLFITLDEDGRCRTACPCGISPPCRCRTDMSDPQGKVIASATPRSSTSRASGPRPARWCRRAGDELRRSSRCAGRTFMPLMSLRQQRSSCARAACRDRARRRSRNARPSFPCGSMRDTTRRAPPTPLRVGDQERQSRRRR